MIGLKGLARALGRGDDRLNLEEKGPGEIAEIVCRGEPEITLVRFHPLTPQSSDLYLDVHVKIKPNNDSYDFSKIYYCTERAQEESEDRVLCFKLTFKNRFERVRLKIPNLARSTGYLRLRLDALPYTPGSVECRPVTLTDGSDAPRAARIADLIALKEQVRSEVERSEKLGLSTLTHYPESLSLELTAGCNLTCTHCSSHGDAEEHRLNNLRAPFSIPMLEKLGHELFPHLTLVNLVGRGEPMMVGRELWNTLISLADEYRVLLTCVTNGHFLDKRIDETNIRLLDTITVSIDGVSDDVFAANRGGASLSLVLRNVERFHQLRQNADLARRPRLGFSWTLKRNNIHQFPDFIREIRRFDPSLLYVRHLFVFRDKDREQCLVGEAELVNPYLEEAYDLLEGSGIKLDVPPLMSDAA